MKFKTAFLSTVVVLTMTSCGGNKPSPAVIYPTEIVLEAVTASISIGGTVEIKASVKPDNASDKTLGYTITSGSEFITLSDNKVTGTALGSAVIKVYAKAKESISKDFKVTVSESPTPEKVIINGVDEKVELTVGATKQMSATVLPSGAPQNVVWSIPLPYDGADPIATVDSSGLISAKNPGNATLTCKCATNPDLDSSMIITVLATKPTGIKLSRNALTLDEGDERELYAELSPSYTYQGMINHSISDPNVVSFDETTHKLKALKKGTATITFVSNDYPEYSKVCSITVNEKIKPEIKEYNPGVYGDYYKIDGQYLTWTNSDDLLSKLNTISRKTYNPIRYNGSPTNWMSNKDADQSLNDFTMVQGVYTDENINKDATQKEWSREHAFAASLMTGKATGEATKTLGMATDFHNLYASYANANSSRGNNNFGFADSVVTKKAAGGTDPTHESTLICNNVNTRDGGNDSYEWNFEPSDNDKGKLSRAIFYMAMMYGPEQYGGLKVTEKYTKFDSNIRDKDNNPINPKAHGNLSDLLDFSLYPVDELEYQHNESVYTYKIDSKTNPQGNRNPFVDYPQLVEYCFGDNKNESGSLVNLQSSYEKLERSSSEHSHYAIGDKTVREYSVGETLTKDKVDYYDVKKNASKATSTDFAFNVATPENYVFTEADAKAGKKDIIIDCDDGKTIKYTVSVVGQHISSSTYFTHLVSSDKYVTDPEHDTIVTKDPKSISWKPQIDMTMSFGTGAAESISKESNGNGVMIGNSISPVQSLSISTNGQFSHQGKNLIEYIWVTAHAASGKTANLKFYINDEVVYSATVTQKGSGVYFDFRYDLPTPTAGNVKIEITNIDAAIYLEYVAINAISK